MGTCQFNWNFIATEINPAAYKNAKKIVKKNFLKPKIKILLVNSAIIDEVCQSFDVAICNPPFFEYGKNKIDGYGGIEEELSVSGGELKFVKKYMVESWKKRNQVLWFTCLIGIKSHLSSLISFLSTNFINANYITTTLYQGNTLRWAIAWRFTKPKNL